MNQITVAHDYQRQLQAICDNATVALFIMDEHQRCVFMNRAAEKLTGFTLAELQGNPLHNYIHHTRPDGSPYPLEDCPIDRALLANNQQQGEEVFVHKDGTFYTVAFTASPIRDGATVTGTVIEVRDISEQKRREREGEELRESLEIALKSSNAAVWEVDLVNKTVKGDAYLARLFNVPLEKCINGTSLLDDYLRPIHEEDIARVERVLGNSIANGEPFDVDYRIVQPDKSSIWVAARGIIVRDESETATRFHGLVIDITERKRIQEQLQTSEARHRLLIDSAQDFAIITLDLDGIITGWNTGAEQITGFSETEVIGKKADIIFTPEDRANDVPSKEIATALRDGRAGDMRWHLRKTGARFFANGVMVSVKDDAGNVRELLKIMRDETAGKLNENRLHESERRYRTLFESINDGFCVIEKIESKPGEPVDFLYTEANPAFAAQSGIKDVIGKTIRRVIPGEADEWIDIYDAVATTGKAIRFERELVTLGRVLELYAFRVEDETHRRVAVIFTDITNRKRAEEDLRESQARLRFTLESANVGDWDLDLVTGKAQRSFLRDKCFGATTPFDDWSYERFLTFVHPADVERVKRDFGQALTEQKDWHFECRVVWADGSVHWIEGRGSVYRTENEKPARMLGIVADITERKRAEQALRESEVRYRTVAETASDAIIQINERSEILFINQAGERIFGYKVEEMIGQSLTMLMPEHTHAAHRAGIRRYLETGKRHLSWAGIELPGHRRDGSDFPLEISFGEFNQDGKRFFIGIARDITERKEAEAERAALLEHEQKMRAQAEEASRLKDEFLATMSHELRTPLTAVLGWTQMLRSNNLDEAGAKRALDTIERNARAQQQLIEDLLDVSRIITGKLRLDIRNVDPTSFIDAAIEALRPAAEAKNIRIQKVLDSGIGAVSGDSDRLQQVVWNLLSNAVKFTPKGGRVQVRLERVNSHIEIITSDTGQGIAPEFLPFVFDRFRQADGSTTRAFGGLGLGLSIVRHLVEQHGGSCHVESHGEGHGATFIVKLPLVSVYERMDEAERVHPRTNTQSLSVECPEQLDNLRLLVVDDEPDTSEMLKIMLAKCGAQITLAASADEVLKDLELTDFDILISDIGMPHRDGYELITEIRKLPVERNGKIPAIALTAYARTEDRLRALRSGYQMHVPKPVELAELVAVVASLASRHSNER